MISDQTRSISALTPCGAICARIVIPDFETFAEVTLPIGSSSRCIQSSGIGSLYSAPSGSKMSPSLSTVGAEATPSMIRWSSSTALKTTVE